MDFKAAVGKPCEAPSPNAAPISRPPPISANCHCNSHSSSPRVEQFKFMAEKELQLCQDYAQLRKQMVDVTNDILDHPCDDLDSKMLTMFQATYKKRSLPVPDYEDIIAASQSTAPIPMDPHRLGVLTSIKDPTHFSENPPVVRPTINPPGPVHTGVSPIAIQMYFKDLPVRSEYMGNISAAGKALMVSMRRYREPMPSTRRRADDTCV